MFAKLPAELRFHVLPEFGIYMPGRRVPTEVRLHGEITFSFEATDRSDILSVRIRDLWLNVVPFALAIDIDHDGLLESIEVGNIELGPGDFDLDASKGTLDVTTGEFVIDWVFTLTPEKIPFLREADAGPMRLSIPDRGWMDLTKGTFEIHRGVFELGMEPFKGALIRGSATGYTNNGWVMLGITIPGQGAQCPSFEGKDRQKEVTICEGDQVLLCWIAREGVQEVEIQPGGHKHLSPQGPQARLLDTPQHPLPGVDPPWVEYTATTSGGGFDPRSDTVLVKFYNGEPIKCEARPDGNNYRWYFEVSPHSFSANILVDTIELVKGGRCLDWNLFHVFHEYPPYPAGPSGGIPNQQWQTDTNSWLPIPIGRGSVPAAGTWYFYPLDVKDKDDPSIIITHGPDPKDYKNPLCFNLRGHCRR
jgi:hypothetical protein